MSLSGNVGFFGVATQIAKGTPNVTGAQVQWVEAINAPFALDEDTRLRRTTIGESPFGRGAYKVGTGMGASVSFEVTSQPIGQYLWYLMGDKAAPVDNLDGTYTHVFKMATDKYSIPYITVHRGVGGQIQEYGQDCKIATANLGFAAGDAVTAGFGIRGIRPVKDATAFTPAYDTNPIMTMTGSGSSLTAVINGTTYGSGSGTIIDVLAAQMQVANIFPPKRYRVGSVEDIDLTLVERSGTIQIVAEISDDNLYDEICYDGNNWKETVSTGTLQVVASDGQSTPHTLQMDVSNALFNTFLVANEPERIVTATFSTTVLKDDGGDTLKFTLVTDKAAYS